MVYYCTLKKEVHPFSSYFCYSFSQVSEKESSLHLYKMSAPSDQKSSHQTKASDTGHSYTSHTVSTSEEYVLLYLLENNRLLSAAKNQLKSESQVIAIVP